MNIKGNNGSHNQKTSCKEVIQWPQAAYGLVYDLSK